jgi:hypothetical protein
MGGHEDFESTGERGKSHDTPEDCDTCQYIELVTDVHGYWDTVHDARQIYWMVRPSVTAGLWKACWDKFHCPPPDKKCDIRKACKSEPTVVWGWADLKKTPGDNILRWVVYVLVGRKIQCVKDGPEKDIEPQIPAAPKDDKPQK